MPKGKLPAGLAAWQAAHKKGSSVKKAPVKKMTKKKK